MKIRLMIQRTVQPPIDTRATVGYKSIDIDISNQSYLDFLNGLDCLGCGISFDVAGIEINPKLVDLEYDLNQN